MKHCKGLFYLVLFAAISAGGALTAPSAMAASGKEPQLGASVNGENSASDTKENPPSPPPKPGPRDGGADD